MALHTKYISIGSPDTSDPLPTWLERLLALLNFDSVKLCKCFFIGASGVMALVMVSTLMKVLGLTSRVYRGQKPHMYLCLFEGKLFREYTEL